MLKDIASFYNLIANVKSKHLHEYYKYYYLLYGTDENVPLELKGAKLSLAASSYSKGTNSELSTFISKSLKLINHINKQIM